MSRPACSTELDRERERKAVSQAKNTGDRSTVDSKQFFKIDLFEQLLYFCQISSLLLFLKKGDGHGGEDKA